MNTAKMDDYVDFLGLAYVLHRKDKEEIDRLKERIAEQDEAIMHMAAIVDVACEQRRAESVTELFEIASRLDAKVDDYVDFLEGE